VFIFDEIHAYNPKLTGLMMATVRYLIGHRARCMFITATLPTFLPKLVERECQVSSSLNLPMIIRAIGKYWNRSGMLSNL
jgi:CRISPR/Cas system-associated endonuclease/helicase Cas3